VLVFQLFQAPSLPSLSSKISSLHFATVQTDWIRRIFSPMRTDKKWAINPCSQLTVNSFVLRMLLLSEVTRAGSIRYPENDCSLLQGSQLLMTSDSNFLPRSNNKKGVSWFLVFRPRTLSRHHKSPHFLHPYLVLANIFRNLDGGRNCFL
jgi:hypothetical protein